MACSCLDLVDEVRGRLELDDMPAPTRPAFLAFDLPLGMTVFVDGRDLGVNPGQALELPAGEHEVNAVHACGRNVSAKFVLVEGETTTVDTAAMPGLTQTDLHLAVSSLHGEPIAPRIRIGNYQDPKSTGESEHEIPADGWVKLVACPQRVIVTSGNPQLGAYWEDIIMAAPKQLTRKVTLAPGPDMVRLAGGPFTMGMRTSTLADIERFNQRTDLDEDEGTWDPVPQRETVIAPFELDRHPVTAAQFETCWDAGACKDDGAYLGVPDDGREWCASLSTIPLDHGRADVSRKPMPGRADFATNCVEFKAAERYCRWTGKRLPTADEWEYAARSGRDDWDCAPGKTETECSARVGGYGSEAWLNRNPIVCKIPEDTTAHGVCDFMHFEEWVTNKHSSPGQSACRSSDRPVRGGGHAPWDRGMCEKASWRHASVAFRCARDVGDGDQGS